MSLHSMTSGHKRLLHTQEARGSSPCAPTIESIAYGHLERVSRCPIDPQTAHISDLFDTEFDTELSGLKKALKFWGRA